MKKIGIVTYQYNNYGTKLQNYALKYVLNGLGHEVESVVVRPRKDGIMILAKLLIVSPVKFVVNKYAKFNAFSKMHLNQRGTTYFYLRKLDAKFDYFIAGSDQIWNPNHLKTRRLDVGLFFLTFAKESKRIAYAPSIGVDDLPEAMKPLYGNLISQFTALSVREPSGAQIVQRLIGEDHPVVPDPVLLLKREDWGGLTMAQDEALREKSYVVIYYLSSQPASVYKNIRMYVESMSFDVVEVAGDRYKQGAIVPDPAQFVSLIKNAKAVFTDSFHACVFSVVFKVPFMVRRRTDVRQFARIQNLLDMFDLGAPENDELIEGQLSVQKFNQVDSVLQECRDKGIGFLKEAMR